MNIYSFIVATFVIMASRGVVGLTTQPASRISYSNGQHGGLVFYWFRLGDLRLHDNPGLERAAAYCRETHSNLIPLFCFDPRIFGAAAITEFGSMKCAPRRAKFGKYSTCQYVNSQYTYFILKHIPSHLFFLFPILLHIRSN